MHNVLLMLVSDTSIITRTFYYLKPGLAVNKKVGKDFFAHLLINRTTKSIMKKSSLLKRAFLLPLKANYYLNYLFINIIKACLKGLYIIIKTIGSYYF